MRARSCRRCAAPRAPSPSSCSRPAARARRRAIRAATPSSTRRCGAPAPCACRLHAAVRRGAHPRHRPHSAQRPARDRVERPRAGAARRRQRARARRRARALRPRHASKRSTSCCPTTRARATRSTCGATRVPSAWPRRCRCASRDPGVDAVLALHVARPRCRRSTPRAGSRWLRAAPTSRCSARGSARSTARRGAGRARRGGIVNFYTPENAVDAFSFLAAYRRNQAWLLEAPPLQPEPEPLDLGAAERCARASPRRAARCSCATRSARCSRHSASRRRRARSRPAKPTSRRPPAACAFRSRCAPRTAARRGRAPCARAPRSPAPGASSTPATRRRAVTGRASRREAGARLRHRHRDRRRDRSEVRPGDHARLRGRLSTTIASRVMLPPLIARSRRPRRRGARPHRACRARRAAARVDGGRRAGAAAAARLDAGRRIALAHRARARRHQRCVDGGADVGEARARVEPRGAPTPRTGTWRSIRIPPNLIDDRRRCATVASRHRAADPARGRRARARVRRGAVAAVALLPLLLPAERADAVDARALHAGRLRPRDGAGRGRRRRPSARPPVFVGVARYVANPDAESAEFAIVVADDLAEARRRAGADRAPGRVGRCGARAAHGIVLRENIAMLAFVRRGFVARTTPTRPTR